MSREIHLGFHARRPSGPRRSYSSRVSLSTYSLNKRKEWLSRSYVEAIATTAGYQMQILTDDLDGTDVVIRDGGVTVEFQLKATAVPKLSGSTVSFDLDVATYNKLRDPVRSAPGYLVLMHLPGAPEDWIDHSVDQLLIRHCTHWCAMADQPLTTNAATQRVKMPIANMLDVPSLHSIMQAARARLQ
jgi:hypothetical protein